MALVKLDGQIVSITGTSGGDVWKRDSSGQHVTSMQRHVKSEPTIPQMSQRDWYTLKKHAERDQNLPEEDDLEPPHGPVFCVLRPLVFFFYTKRSDFKPKIEPVNIGEANLHDIEFWVDHQQNIWQVIPHITRDAVITFMAKWWWQAYTISGGTPQLALHFAITKITEAAAYCTAGISALAAGAIILFLALAAVAATAIFYSREYTRHDFPLAAFLLLNDTGLFWGRLVGRPSWKMWDILLGPACDLPQLLRTYTLGGSIRGTRDWFFFELIEVIKPKLLWWETYTPNRIRTSFYSHGFQIHPTIIRSVLPVKVAYHRAFPIGYIYTGTTPWDFVDDLYTRTGY